MSQNQNETTEITSSRDLADRRNSTHTRLGPKSAFTLVELLVVISIIAVLAGLVTGAAINALNNSKRATITLEIQQIESAIEDLKNEYGAYPPNVFANSNMNSTIPTIQNSQSAEQTLNARELARFMKKSFSRSVEFRINLTSNPPARFTPDAELDNLYPLTVQGLSPSEALVFWLQGFSQDVTRPFTGTDLDATTIEYTNPVDGSVSTAANVITIDSRTPRYDFDRGRLRMTHWPDGTRRFIEMLRADGTVVQIQLYEYLAPNSEEPFVYFDTSRETPEQVVANWTTTEFFYSSLKSNGTIYPLKQLRADTPDLNTVTEDLQYVEYVNSRKFQVLHCGLDDAWGNFLIGGSLNESNGTLTTDVDFKPQLLFPTGPFLGDIRDTLGNFGTGTLEDAQE